jgi:hypothetical protein
VVPHPFGTFCAPEIFISHFEFLFFCTFFYFFGLLTSEGLSNSLAFVGCGAGCFELPQGQCGCCLVIQSRDHGGLDVVVEGTELLPAHLLRRRGIEVPGIGQRYIKLQIQIYTLRGELISPT